MSTTTFSLEGKALRLDTASDVEKHISPLTSSYDTITKIDLSGNTISPHAADALAPHLSKLTALETANLGDIFTSRDITEIPPALDALLTALLPLKNLHTVILNDNAFGLRTQAPLVNFLEKHVPLRHLILNNNGLGPAAGTLIANALTRLAEAKKAAQGEKAAYLETIVCGRNRLESGSSAAWAEALEAHSPSLRELRMTQNGIRVEGMTAIVREGLRHAKKLQVLDLQDNLFTVPGAQALVDVLGGWTELKELSVQDTLLRARGGMLLAETLAKGHNKQLEILRLQYNEINAKGVAALLRAAKTALPKLQRVELNGNMFSEEDPSIEALGELLSERREEAGAEADDEAWGLDELDELDDEEEDEEDDDEAEGNDDDEDDDDVEMKAEKELQLADQAENQKVSQKQDDDVDDLADALGRTHV